MTRRSNEPTALTTRNEINDQYTTNTDYFPPQDLYEVQYRMPTKYTSYAGSYAVAPQPRGEKKVETVTEEKQDDQQTYTQDDKRLRRLMKNRESAQLSRERKKMYLENLEKRAEITSKENTELKGKVSTLHSENKLLKEHVRCLKNVVNQATTLSVVLNALYGSKQLAEGLGSDITESIKKLSDNVDILANKSDNFSDDEISVNGVLAAAGVESDDNEHRVKKES